MAGVPLLAHVALLEDLPGTDLTRGSIGTVVEVLGSTVDPAYLVEFSDDDGQAYAFQALHASQLMLLHRRSADAA